jgi:hypothetical protein
MLELTLKRKSGTARIVNGISVYADLNRFKKNFRLISCTLLKNSAKYGCITNIHNHSGQGALILGIRPF